MHKYRAFSQIVRGYRHVKNGLVCQDYAMASDAAPNCSVIVVADGHGGNDYFRSDRGAKFITQAAAAELMDFAAETTALHLRGASERREIMHKLFDRILQRWKEQIEADIFDDPFSETQMENVSPKLREQYLAGKYTENAYGTTLIAAIITEKYWLVIQLGDGRCVSIRPDGSCEQPVRVDERCKDNLTTSVCDEDAIKEFRYSFSEQMPAAVFAFTDGVEAAFNDMDGAYGFCQELASTYLEKGKNGLTKTMEQILPALSKKGNGDDVSIAGLMCTEKLEPISEVLKLEEKLRRSVIQWENAGHYVRDHEKEQHQLQIKLDECRSRVSVLSKQIEQDTEALEKMQDQIRLLEHNCNEHEIKLCDLNEKLEAEKKLELDLEAKLKKMGDEQRRLQTQLDEAASTVENLMDGTEQARKTAEEKKKAQGESLFDIDDEEDFTEPWAFVNR